jgi:uncharacterized protein YhfF
MSSEEVGMDVETFWQAYLASLPAGAASPGDRPPAWFFSDSEQGANRLGSLVLRGLKSGTASLYWSYKPGIDPLPKAGDLAIITDFSGQPLCLIETTQVEILPFDQVSEAHAAAEGEGDLSLEYWRRAHWEAFGRECRRLGRKAAEDMPVVCERFQVLFRRPAEA